MSDGDSIWVSVPLFYAHFRAFMTDLPKLEELSEQFFHSLLVVFFFFVCKFWFCDFAKSEDVGRQFWLMMSLMVSLRFCMLCCLYHRLPT